MVETAKPPLLFHTGHSLSCQLSDYNHPLQIINKGRKKNTCLLCSMGKTYVCGTYNAGPSPVDASSSNGVLTFSKYCFQRSQAPCPDHAELACCARCLIRCARGMSLNAHLLSVSEWIRCQQERQKSKSAVQTSHLSTVGPVNIQISASSFWGKQIHQTRARIPKKYLKRMNIKRS
jgi:hypothetical protein